MEQSEDTDHPPNPGISLSGQRNETKPDFLPLTLPATAFGPIRTGSLAILNPSAYTLPKGKDIRPSTAAEIESICHRLTHLISMHDFDSPDFKELMSPEFIAYLEHVPHPHIESRRAYIDNFKGIVEQHPSYRLELQSLSMDVNEPQGTATVWVSMLVTGHPVSVQRESIVVMFFRRLRGKWVAVKQLGVRGVPGFF